jgi:putative spermidine/putrescine transport system substrate-binding protein
MLNPETQALIAETFYSKPTNTQAAVPPELDLDLTVLDWEYFSDNREQWIERWEREIAA